MRSFGVIALDEESFLVAIDSGNVFPFRTDEDSPRRFEIWSRMTAALS